MVGQNEIFAKSTPSLHYLCRRCSTPSEPYKLNVFEVAVLACALEDAIKELSILMSCSNEWRVARAQADLSLLRALKYKVEQPSVTDELDGIDPKRLGCEEYKLRKMFSDRQFICNVIESTYLSVTLKKDYSVLAVSVKDILDEKERRENLMINEANNKLLRRELKRQLRQVKIHIKTAKYDADCSIAQLRNSVEDAALDSAIRSRYVDNWQHSRTEQNRQQIKDKESVREDVIEKSKQRYDQEQRVHAEIEMLTTIRTNETLSKVESWMEKYDKDMEAMDLKIQIMKNNHVVQREQREELERTIEEHDAAMKNWLKFKEDRENARLYREKMTNAALVVQAWWRGILVRNQLGPYKPPPTRKGGNKKAKK